MSQISMNKPTPVIKQEPTTNQHNFLYPNDMVNLTYVKDDEIDDVFILPRNIYNKISQICFNKIEKFSFDVDIYHLIDLLRVAVVEVEQDYQKSCDDLQEAYLAHQLSVQRIKESTDGK